VLDIFKICQQAKIYTFFQNQYILSETDFIPGCLYAYYLYENNQVVEKIAYTSLLRVAFELKPKVNSEYKVKFFYQIGNQKYSFMGKAIKYKGNKDIQLEIPPISGKSMGKFEIREMGARVDREILILETKGFLAFGRKDLSYYKYDYPIRWLENPYQDRNWLFQFQAWRMLDCYLERLTESDIRSISKIINDWVEFEKKSRNKWLWYDMATGLRALKIVYYLRAISRIGVYHRIDDLKYLIQQHLLHLSNIHELSKGNHAIFQLNGLMALLSITIKMPGVDLDKCRQFAKKHMASLLRRQLGNIGIHTENSPDYHFFVQGKISKILSSDWWDVEQLNGVGELLQKSEKAKAWFLDANYKCVPIGDSAESKRLVDEELALLWPHIKVKSTLGAQLDGYSIIRSDFGLSSLASFYLLLQGSFSSEAHKHSDCLSVIWQEKGEYILVDSGKYGYQKDFYRDYFLSSQAHNTIVIDDCSFSRSEEDVYGSAITISPLYVKGCWITQGRVHHKKLGYTHVRNVVYRDSELYIIDFIESDEGFESYKKCEVFWHVEPWTTLAISDKNKILIKAMKTNLLLKTKVVADEVITDDFKTEIVKGRKEPSYLGWISKEYLKVEPTSAVKLSFNFKKKCVVISSFTTDSLTAPDFFHFDITGEVCCMDSDVLGAIISNEQ